MSNARAGDPYNLCQCTFLNGRMCGLPAHPKHDGLCLNHARVESYKNEPREEDISAELCSVDSYVTQIGIHHSLGKLFNALAGNRISVKRAASLAYIADLLLRSQAGAKEEARRWEEDLPVLQKWLCLKYREGEPKYPDAAGESSGAEAPDLGEVIVGAEAPTP
ncbi:MAG: hypothetical protein WBL50_03385 [Candidatus Acidiferrum sp.]